MEAMRESWTDDRLDDLNGKVDSLWIETKTEFAAVRGEMKDEFASVRAEIRERFEAMMDRLYSMQRLMIQFCGVAMAALIGLIATQI
jgi:hypothetical protein